MRLPKPIASLASTVGSADARSEVSLDASAWDGETVTASLTKVRITGPGRTPVTVREGIGTGFGRALQPELAHDIALKAAETDATKRALATFGNPFGLALYDRGQSQVTKARTRLRPRRRRNSRRRIWS